MDLLDRYLAAVARDLPAAQRADVTAELRDDLLSMVEDAESRLGRPQTPFELEAMLVAFGHPLQVAGRYRRTQYLIGPEVFPFWWAWLRAGVAIVAAVYVALAVLSVFSAGGLVDQIGDISPSLSVALVFTFGTVTLVAAGVERWGKPSLLARWTPFDLPPVTGKPPSRFEQALELCMSLAFLAWWFGLIRFSDWLPIPARLDMAPVWTTWFWPIAAYAVLDVVAHLVALIRPGRARLYLILNIIRCLFGAAILAAVFREGHFVVLNATQPVDPALQETIDRGFAIGVLCVTLGLLVRAAIDAWRLRQTSATLPALGRAPA